MSQINYPLNLFLTSLHSILGRFLLYTLVLLSGMALGAGVELLLEAQAVDTSAIVLWPFLVPALVIGGFAQGWGILSYGILFGFGLLFLTTEIRARWLWLAFVIQTAEAFRCMAVWSDLGA